MKKTLLVLLLFIIIFSGRVYAQDQAPADTGQEPAATEEAPPEEAYQFPVIPPAGTIFGGYRFVDLSGSTRAGEYEYLHDSVALGGELRIFSFPHRLHLDIDFRNKKDYFGDVGYAYEDIVLLRGINRTLFHNLDNINLAGGFTPNATFGVNPKDEGVKYGVRWGMTTVSLRFKTPDYPLHVFLEGSIIDKDGTMQQRFLSETGSYVRTSESRDIDWETRQLTVGTNAHLGPLEVEYSHGEKRFDPGGTHVLYDSYAASVSGGTTIRNAGIYPHNLVPDLAGSSNTIRMHTSYTGRIVASATLTKIDRENNDSGAKADYFIGAGEVTWTAATNLAVFVKYRHKEADIDNPLTVTIDNVCSPSNYPAGCIVKPSISSRSDTASATVRYRPFSGLTLRAAFDYDRIRRENFEQWDLPEKTQHYTESLSADMRIIRNLNLRAGYAHKDINDPAYNVEPDHSDEGHATISWTPLQRITTFVTYSITKERRDDLNTTEGNGSSLTAKNRDVLRDRAMGAVTYLVSEKVSLTGSYTYIHDKIRQDIVVGSDPAEPFVPDTDLAHSYGLTINYIPNDRINLSAGVSYTLSSGAFSITDPALVQPISVASLSALKTRETDCSLSGEYRFRNGFSAGVQYRYTDFNDVLDNPWDDVQDGRVHIVLLTLSKKW
jgi:predicted porin/opacity protein-like surface antigen